MGVTIKSTDEMEDLSISYSSFNELREAVALVYDEGFGKGYKEYNEYFRCVHPFPADCEKMFDTLKEMAKTKHLKPSIFNFLWKSDCDGSISETTCKDLYDLIKDTDDMYWCWGGFKRVMKYCVENNQGAYWL